MKIKFDERGLVPVVVQDVNTKEVLMVAWANEEAIKLTKETGLAHYFSRSRRKLWRKGENSGNVQKVRRILVDCDEDTLLYEVEQTGGACHTGFRSCFYRTIEGEVVGVKVFDPKEVYDERG
jgi:phosphoribosyl-AMP cyclohydrolase